MVDEEGPSVGRYPHLPARREEALLGLVLGLGGAVGRRLGGLGVGHRVFDHPPHLDVVGALKRIKKVIYIQIAVASLERLTENQTAVHQEM